MNNLKENDTIREMSSGGNFEYVIRDVNKFVDDGYDAILRHSDKILIPCMKTLNNGKLSLYYQTENYKPASSMLSEMKSDTLVSIASNLLEKVVMIKESEDIDYSGIDLCWEKIFVNEETLDVRLIYVPLSIKIFESEEEFENGIRMELVKKINELAERDEIKAPYKFVLDLCTGISLKEAYEKDVERRNNGEGNATAPLPQKKAKPKADGQPEAKAEVSEAVEKPEEKTEAKAEKAEAAEEKSETVGKTETAEAEQKPEAAGKTEAAEKPEEKKA